MRFVEKVDKCLWKIEFSVRVPYSIPLVTWGLRIFIMIHVLGGAAELYKMENAKN